MLAMESTSTPSKNTVVAFFSKAKLFIRKSVCSMRFVATVIPLNVMTLFAIYLFRDSSLLVKSVMTIFHITVYFSLLLYNMGTGVFPKTVHPDGRIEENSGVSMILPSSCFLFFWYTILCVSGTRPATCLSQLLDPEDRDHPYSPGRLPEGSAHYSEKDMIVAALVSCCIAVLLRESERKLERCHPSYYAGLLHCMVSMFVCILLTIQCFKEQIHSCQPILRVVEIAIASLQIVGLFAHCHSDKRKRLAACIFALVAFGAIFILGKAEDAVSIRKHDFSEYIGVNFNIVTFMGVLLALFRVKLCCLDMKEDSKRKALAKRVRDALQDRGKNDTDDDTINSSSV